jgi:hypothetical protein
VVTARIERLQAAAASMTGIVRATRHGRNLDRRVGSFYAHAGFGPDTEACEDQPREVGG